MIDGTEWRHILERYPKLCKSFDLKAIESIQDVPRFFAYLLQCFKFLADFDSRFLLNVAPKMKGRRWTAGEYIIKEDEEGTSMYFVHRGAVSVYIKGKRIAELKDHTACTSGQSHRSTWSDLCHHARGLPPVCRPADGP